MPPRLRGHLVPYSPCSCRVDVFTSCNPFLRITVHSSRATPKSFSTTPSQYYPRDPSRNNPLRGMSAIKGTGIGSWVKLSVDPSDIKVPRDVERATEIDPDHGLWGFFKDKKMLATPVEDSNHGIAWPEELLARKSFADLHALWWACLKERNRIATQEYTRKIINAGYGDAEARARNAQVRLTMIHIKKILTLRWYAWEDARKLARTDDSVIVDGGRIIYREPEEQLALLEKEGSSMMTKSHSLPTTAISQNEGASATIESDSLSVSARTQETESSVTSDGVVHNQPEKMTGPVTRKEWT